MIEQANIFYDDVMTGKTEYNVVYDDTMSCLGVTQFKTHTIKVRNSLPCILAHEIYHAFQRSLDWVYTSLDSTELDIQKRAIKSYQKVDRDFNKMSFSDKIDFIYFYALLTAELEANVYAAYKTQDVIPYRQTYMDIYDFLTGEKDEIMKCLNDKTYNDGEFAYSIMLKKIMGIVEFIKSEPSYDNTEKTLSILEEIGYDI